MIETAALSSQMTFAEAAALWIEQQRLYVSPRTTHDHRQYAKELIKHFGPLLLKDITVEHVRAFQRKRSETAGATRVNHELTVLTGVLKELDLWKAIAVKHRSLPIPPASRGQVLTPKQRERLLVIARSRDRWDSACYAIVLALNTTCGGGELLKLRLKDIDLSRRVLWVREGAKNRNRVRGIPLNDAALWAMSRLMEKAKEQGAHLPQHYLFPHNGKGDSGADPNRPRLGWRTAWVAIREKAELPKSFRFYDLRHDAVTRLDERPEISEQVSMRLAGHGTKQAHRIYSHIETQEHKAAVAAIETPLPWSTDDPAKPQSKSKRSPVAAAASVGWSTSTAFFVKQLKPQ